MTKARRTMIPVMRETKKRLRAECRKLDMTYNEFILTLLHVETK